MSKTEGSITFTTDIDDSGFIKGMESMLKSAESIMSSIKNSMDSSGQASAKMSETIINANDKITVSFKNSKDSSDGFLTKMSEVTLGVRDMFKDTISKSDELSTAFGAMDASSDVFNLAKDKIIPMVNSFVEAKTHVESFQASNEGATIAQGVLNGALSAGEVVVGVLSGQIELAAGATALWEGACAALGGPIGVAVVAVAALAAGLAFLGTSMSESQKQHEETMNKINEEQQAYADLQAKQEEQMNANLTELDHTSALNDELKLLVDTNGKVKEGYEDRASFILGELNEASGTNAEIVDGEIQGYADVSKSIDEMLEKKRAQIILEAEEPAYKEAILNATNAQIEADRLQGELTDINSEKQEKEKELEKEYGNDWLERINGRHTALIDSWSDLDEDSKRKQEEYDNQSLTVQGYYDNINKYESDAALIESGNAENFKKVQATTLASKEETTAGKIRALEEEKLANQGYLDHLKTVYATETDDFQKRQLASQIKAKENSIKQKEEEIEGLSSTIVNKGSEYDTAVKDMALNALKSFKGDPEDYFNTSQENILRIINGMNNKDADVRKKARETAQKVLDGLKDENGNYTKSGANVIDGILNGSNSKTGELYATVKSYANNMMNTFNSSLGIRSPSKKFADLAKFIPEGIAKGIKDNEGCVNKATEDMADGLLSTFSNMGLGTVFKDIEQAIFSEQARMASVVQTESKLEMLRMNAINAENKALYGKLDAVIENHVDLDGRELAVSLAPMLSEELAFNWR